MFSIVRPLVEACEAVTFKIAFKKINFLSDENRRRRVNEIQMNILVFQFDHDVHLRRRGGHL